MSETILKNVLSSLDMMWKGMAGLFIVCGGVSIIMMIITKLIKSKGSK
ncbi:MAG: hypothetical protein LBC53_06480 [Spirochaetaceae bacterium]|jgi:hypothetical protein|nr:hypothetical protein [Spirochaetaceae bacterium]